MTQEAGIVQGSLEAFVERHLCRVQYWRCSSEVSSTTSEVEVVRQSHTMTRGHLVDFMFAIDVKSRPFDLGRRGIICCRTVEDDVLAGSTVVVDGQLAAFVH